MHSLEKLKPLALLLLRLGLGIILVYHGYPKLFTHTHDAMQGFEHMGFRVISFTSRESWSFSAAAC